MASKTRKRGGIIQSERKDKMMEVLQREKEIQEGELRLRKGSKWRKE